MVKKILFVVVASVLVALMVPAHADHQSHRQDYIALTGDFSTECDTIVGLCLGGAKFLDVGEGRWFITVKDDKEDMLNLRHTSGAYQINNNLAIPVCFPFITHKVDEGDTIQVYIDGIVRWSVVQPCGLGELTMGTTGTVTITHFD